MIGKSDTKGAELRASRLELRVDKLEDKLEDRQDRIDELRDQLRTKEDQVRYLLQGLREVERTVEQLDARRATLAEANLDVPFLPDYEGQGSRATERIEAIQDAMDDVADAADELAAALDGDPLDEPTDAMELLTESFGGRTADDVAASEAPSVAELWEMWIDADPMDRYHRELLEPYAQAARAVLQERADSDAVTGAKTALTVVKDAFDESRTYLMRRSGDLDGYEVPVDVGIHRIDQDPDLALDRLSTVLEQARALGAVDFFHNLRVELEQAVEDDVEGAGAAAWILTDATVAVLTDDGIKDWLRTGMT